MDIPRTPFDEWEAENRAGLTREYRDYLHSVLEDEGFDLTMAEDYWTWAREEYELLHAYADDEDARA